MKNLVKNTNFVFGASFEVDQDWHLVAIPTPTTTIFLTTTFLVQDKTSLI
jgi:hypothetical protein